MPEINIAFKAQTLTTNTGEEDHTSTTSAIIENHTPTTNAIIEDHIRNIDVAFPFTKNVEGSRHTRDHRELSLTCMFDKGFKIRKGTPYNLMSKRVIDQLPITPDGLDMYHEPKCDKIKLIDGHPLEILGHFRTRWWCHDKDCVDKEIWTRPRFIDSEFFIISADALYDVVVSWEIMAKEEFLKPCDSCAGAGGQDGQGGLHAPLPRADDQAKTEAKRAQQIDLQKKERVVQDKEEEEEEEENDDDDDDDDEA
ncbi:hypothetical protein GTA08_BOTSDO09334 [Neofusicoccum parvum]|uniref:Uncharacterized protein n=1 Tax=Neofusicoccum parvum TaxID=310453 RepID=A0ACB5S1L8_9PEZI|nr:hypothetical protein GTA08_BOTSDO09334 [Neofusicoccum parvum]